MSLKYNKKKQNKRWQGGFTLVELLVALGILSILLSIGMVSVTYYQRNLKVTEMDAIAKEIFVSAQNHITASKATVEWEELENQHQADFDRYFGNRIKEKPSDYPREETWTEGGNGKEHDYHYIVYDGREDTLNSTILDIMLPYGSIDDEVRTNGHYVIEYDYKTATVYGVFYTDNSKKFSYENDIMGVSGLNFKNGRENSERGRETRKNYKNDSGHIIIGYYGGATTTELKSVKLQPLEVEVKNGDTLGVTIRDKNYGNIIEGTKVKTKISFTVTGEESQAVKKTILEINPLGNVQSGENWWTAKEEKNIGVYEVTLDDITKQGGHFADIFPEFIAGENLLIEVEAFSNEVLCTPVKTQVVTNSLFEARYQYEENGILLPKVSISNIRHLQNLSPEVSNLLVDSTQGQRGTVVKVVEQTKSLDWEDFMKEKPKEEKKIYSYESTVIQQKVLATDRFYGIENTALTEYKGNGYTLSHFSLQENADGSVGLFSQIGTEDKKQEMTIQNLVLDSFESKSTTDGGNAGILVGEVREKGTLIGKDIFGINATVIANKQGNAGGLVGKMSDGTLSQCGLYLTDDEEGSANSKLASEKYELGAYNQEKNAIGSQFMVLSEGGVSGGLIGLVENNSIKIEDSFVAIPVITKADENGASGGLIGKNQAQETTIKNSYVSGYTKAGNYPPFYGVSVIGNGGMAGGFIGENHAQTTIKNSYSTVSLYGNTAGGLIGKIEAGAQTFEDAYTTGKITGSDQNAKTGSFIGDTGGMGKISATNSYALKDSNKSLTTTVQGIQEVDYDGLIKATFSDEFKKTADSKIETYSYDGTLLEEEYPFHLVTKTGEKNSDTEKVHYGDWPLKQKMSEGGDMSEEFDIGFLYYEFLEDKEGNPDDTFYYHGWGGFQSDNEYDTSTYKELFTKGEGLVNGLSREPDTYVREEGYLVCISEQYEDKLDELYVNLVARYESKEVPAKQILTKKVNMENLPERFNGYVFYQLDEDTIPDEYRHYFERGTGILTMVFGFKEQGSASLNNKVGISINLKFGDAAMLIDKDYTYGTDSGTLKNGIFKIRSPRHLYNINPRILANSFDDSIIGFNGQKNQFVQTLDIDMEREVNGISYDQQMKQISKMCAQYLSKGYTNIKGIKKHYKIVNLKIQLFGTIYAPAIIDGITLENLTIKGGEEVISGFANENIGFVKNITLNHVNITGKGTVNGFVNKNEKHYSDPENKIKLQNIQIIDLKAKSTGGDTSIVNGFASSNKTGIEEVLLQDILLNGNGNVNGFLDKNSGYLNKMQEIRVKNLEITGKGVVNGFIEDSNNAIIEKCDLENISLSASELVNGFGNTLQGTGSVIDVTITNLKAEGKGEVNGFANINKQPINRCSIHAKEVSPNSYENVKLTGEKVYGFVNTNQNGLISNSYIVGKLIGEQIVSGFVNTNSGWGAKIDYCYANIIIESKGTASGFLYGNNNDNASINNSYVVGSVTSLDKENGEVAGFTYPVNTTVDTIQNCYTALWKMSAKKIYPFGLYQAKYTNTNNDWLSVNIMEGEIETSIGQETAIKKEYTDLIIKQPDVITHKYYSGLKGVDIDTEQYPFKISTRNVNGEKEFWGDWPLKQKKETTQDVGLLYYEKIGDEVYYHGYLGDFSEKGDNPNYKEVMTKGEGLENGLVTESGKYVTEDGYLILFPKKTEWTEETEGTEQTEKENGSKLTVIVGNEKEGEEQKIPPGQRVLLEKENSFHLEGYDAYYFPCDIIKDKIIGENFTYLYINIGKKKNQGTTEFETYINFKFNPYFADCITRNDSEPEKYYVRSVRQLMEINRKVSKQTIYKNAEFIQSLDINFENINFKKLGTSEIIDQFLSSYTVKRYKDNNRTASYVIKGLNVPLFKRIGDANITATVKGVTLVNSNTNGASFAEENYGVIESCAVRAEKPSSDAYSNVTVKAEAGFVGDNKGTIRNSYFVGTVEGDSPSGFVGTNDSNTTIENCYANVIVKGKSFASGFVNTNRGTIKNSFSVGNVHSDGTSYGFIKEFGSGKIENCYSALFHLSGQKIYPFGSGNNYINCSWLDNTYKEGEIQQETIGTAISYEELMKKGTNSITYKYNSSNPNIDTTTKIYPFELSSTDDAYIPMSFWGDWGVQ